MGWIAARHRSREFVQCLKILDDTYLKDITIRIILDNHSEHIYKETRKYLATVANKFEFVFTLVHGSWLSIDLNSVKIFNDGRALIVLDGRLS